MAAVRRILGQVPVKSVIVVLYLVADLGVNWYLRDDPPVKDRCSAEYPELSESLDTPQVLVDGSMTDAYGRVFPPGQFWSEGGVVYGCPCSGVKPCIRKCCGLEKSYDYSFSCVDSDLAFIEALDVVRIVDQRVQRVNVSEDHFSVLASECEISVHPRPPFTFKFMNPTEDGIVLNVIFGSSFDQSEYCMDSFYEGALEGESDVFVVICKPPSAVVEFRDRRLWQRNLVYYVLRVASASINLLTLAVFCLLPQLRAGCGKPIMCYLLSRIYSSLDDAINTTRILPTAQSRFCHITSPLALFFALTTRAWQLTIAYQIWTAFRPGSTRATEFSGMRQFLVYSAVAWGVPFAMVTVAVLADLVSWAPEFLTPRFGEQQCWFNSGDAKFIYFVVPYYVVELLVMALCLSTLLRLRSSRIDSTALQDNADSRTHNTRDIQWSRLYARTSLLMGVNYALLPLAWILNNYYTLSRFITISILNVDDIRGAEILLIFVLKRETLTLLAKRLGCWRQPQPTPAVVPLSRL